MTKFLADRPLLPAAAERHPTSISYYPVGQLHEAKFAAETTPAALYQLPKSGDWVRLADISMVRAYNSSLGTRCEVAFGVLGSRYCILIECETLEEAESIRDQIAADHSAALHNPG